MHIALALQDKITDTENEVTSRNEVIQRKDGFNEEFKWEELTNFAGFLLLITTFERA